MECFVEVRFTCLCVKLGKVFALFIIFLMQQLYNATGHTGSYLLVMIRRIEKGSQGL